MVRFFTSVDMAAHNATVFVRVPEIGWYAQPQLCIAKTLGDFSTSTSDKDVRVAYDGSRDITVYLASEDSFSTNVSADWLTEINQGGVFEVGTLQKSTERSGVILQVTCKAGSDGEPTLTVPLTQKFVLDPDAETVNYTVTFCKDGKYVAPAELLAGEPAAIKVMIKDKEGHVNEETCWFGVGEYANNKYDILSGSSMGNSEDKPNFAMLAVGLWRKNERSDGTWDLAMLSKEEAEQVMQQATFRLEFHAQSGQEATPDGKTPDEIKETYPYRDLIEAVDAAAALGMPEAACYPLEAQHEGKWRVEAVCTIGGKTYRAHGTLERRVSERTTINDCTTVREINEALDAPKAQFPQRGRFRARNPCLPQELSPRK